MADNKLNEMEIAIIDAVRQTQNEDGFAERFDIGKYCRTIYNDYDSPGPTLWTEATTRMYGDTMEGLVEKGYIAWRTYLLRIELTDQGKKYITDNKAALDAIPKVEDNRQWFKKQNKRMML
jgi:hypothetical protein